MLHNAKTKIELNLTVRAGRIPNALLFSGPADSGRKEAAFWFVKACNCMTPQSSDSPVCNQCRSCLKINADAHPDIIVLCPDTGKKIIPISRIRHIHSILSSKPNEARYRMVLIDDAHLMNTQAQNALLKMLEEPPSQTFFVLITEQASTLLPTIVSRCRSFDFKPLPADVALEKIVHHYPENPLLAQIALKTADFNYRKALVYLGIEAEPTRADWTEKRKWVLSTLFDIISTGASNQALACWKGLSASSTISLEPDIIPDLLGIIKTFFRDLVVFQHAPKKIVNLDFSTQFKDISVLLSEKNRSVWMDTFFETENKLSLNASPRLTLDSFFIKLAATGKNAI